ncbi:hypothetical protein [Bacillus sp. R86525]|uniref:hypothetical protein n=1 Tax=Bacillus sp. R86525 TaxID=3101709 RepID=UPI00366DD2F9
MLLLFIYTWNEVDGSVAKFFTDRKLGWCIYVYSIDGVRLAMKSQGQTLFYHYSPRGDVVAMTDSIG